MSKLSSGSIEHGCSDGSQILQSFETIGCCGLFNVWDVPRGFLRKWRRYDRCKCSVAWDMKTSVRYATGHSRLRSTSPGSAGHCPSRGKAGTSQIRLGTVVEECDESEFWLEFVKAVPIADGAELDRLLQEAKELLAIFGTSLATAKENARLKAEARRAERERARRKRR